MGRQTMLGLIAARLVWFVPIVVIGIIAELVSQSQQRSVQSGIDAHTEEVYGTYVDLVPGSGWFQDDTYVVSFRHDDRLVQARLRSLPGYVRIGNSVCLEVDATHPEYARVCGTRGGLEDAQQGLAIGTATLVSLLLVIALASWRNSRRDEVDLVAQTIAPAAETVTRGDLLLRPAPATRWTMATVFSGVFAVTGLMMGADPTYQGAVTLPALFLVLGALVALGCLQVGVRCSGGMITVYGLVFPHHVARGRMTSVAFAGWWDRPSMDWQDRAGRRHRARLKWFGIDAMSPDSIRDFHQAQVEKLKAWINSYQRSRSGPAAAR